MSQQHQKLDTRLNIFRVEIEKHIADSLTFLKELLELSLLFLQVVSLLFGYLKEVFIESSLSLEALVHSIL